MGKRYQDIVSGYAPLVRDAGQEISDAQIERAGQISVLLLHGCPEADLKADQRVIDEAIRLVEEEGAIHASSQNRFNGIAQDEINAVIHSATLVVAEREIERKKPFDTANLGDVMIKTMQELFRGKQAVRASSKSAAGFQR